MRIVSQSRSVNDFIQYSAGGAFVAQDSNSESNNIYVSLNYLQGNIGVSYTDSFGAINEDGVTDMYTFVKGDKLRIISYNPSGDLRIFPWR